jgi:hypothetical protein
MSQDTPKNIGTQFEEDLAHEFGLKLVPGSGNQFHSKLDLHGKGARWSLKATEKASASIKAEDIDEAIRACYNVVGDGSIPLWAYRIKGHDMVMMRKEDFLEFQRGELELTNTIVDGKYQQRAARAMVPRLLRDE